MARRLPAAKPGSGRAARYVSGKMPVTAKNQHRIESNKSSTPAQNKPATNGAGQLNDAMSEEERIAAMFAAGGQQWEQQQQQMANQKAVHRPGFQKPMAVPDKPLPPGYTCHRCGEKGHWIQACPTNTDPNFDGRPKFRRTTGIPRSFLKIVEKPTALADDGTVDVSKLPQGVMYTSTGEWAVVEPDKAAWEQFQAKNKASADKAEAASSDNQEIREKGLECPIDKRLFVDPMKTPCCGKTYCRDCIENTLLGNDFVCPGCSSDNVLVDNLISDEETVAKIKAYEEEKKAEVKKEKEKSASPVADKAVPANSEKEATKSPSVKPAVTGNGTASPSTTPQSTKVSPHKRPAEDELPNNRIPTGPAAMRKDNSQTPAGALDQNFVQQMNAMTGNFPNMGGMPFNPMMGMPMMGMNPMMMNGGWNGVGFPQQQGNMYGGFNPMMQNGGYGQQWQGNQGWGTNGMNGMNGMPQQNGRAFTPNQNGMPMNGAGAGDDGDAYFRKPVNPHRHQGRNRRQRSVDYREM